MLLLQEAEVESAQLRNDRDGLRMSLTTKDDAISQMKGLCEDNEKSIATTKNEMHFAREQAKEIRLVDAEAIMEVSIRYSGALKFYRKWKAKSLASGVWMKQKLSSVVCIVRISLSLALT